MSQSPLSPSWLFAQECTFLRSSPSIETLPDYNLPEIAFAGRSNVGKSTIINALTGRSHLARASNTPGRTQQLNFFQLANHLILVDMPGYGYAEAPKDLIKQWNELIRLYLLGRPTLKRVYLLIDSRHGLKKNDLEMMNMMDETAVSYQIILTKGDKITPTQLTTLVEKTEKILKIHGAAYPVVIPTSSEKRIGIDTFREAIFSVL